MLDETIEVLGLKDCFVDSDSPIDIDDDDVAELCMEIDEAIQRNERELNRGVEILASFSMF